MKKRLLSALLVLAMVLTMLPVQAFAEEQEPTAPVEAATNGLPAADQESGIITLAAETYTLTADVTDPVHIVVPQGVVATLDLAGHALKVTASNDDIWVTKNLPYAAGIRVSGNLTIKDSSTAGTGKIEYSASGMNVIIANGPGAVFTLESGELINTEDYGTCCSEGGRAVVAGGKITSKYAALTGNNTEGVMNFEVSGGTLNTTLGPAIYQSGPLNLTVSGGTINGGICVRMGTINITGGTISNKNPQNSDTIDGFYSYNGNVWFPNAITVFGGTYTGTPNNDLGLTITGGTIESDQGDGIAIYALGKVNQTMNVSISGVDTDVSGKAGSQAVKVYSAAEIKALVEGASKTWNTAYAAKNNACEPEISGGTFSRRPSSSYIAAGYKVNEQVTDTGKTYAVVAGNAEIDPIIAVDFVADGKDLGEAVKTLFDLDKAPTPPINETAKNLVVIAMSNLKPATAYTLSMTKGASEDNLLTNNVIAYGGADTSFTPATDRHYIYFSLDQMGANGQVKELGKGGEYTITVTGDSKSDSTEIGLYKLGGVWGTEPQAPAEPVFAAALADEEFAQKKMSAFQTNVQVGKAGTDGVIPVTGTLRYVEGWTAFNETLTDEQNGYYVAIAVPKQAKVGTGTKDIAAMKLMGKDENGDPVKKEYTGNELTGAFTDNNNTACNIVMFLGNTEAVAKGKTFRIWLKYGDAADYTEYKFSCSGATMLNADEKLPLTPSFSVVNEYSFTTPGNKKILADKGVPSLAAGDGNVVAVEGITAKYVNGWTDFNGNDEEKTERNGNFLALKITLPNGVAATDVKAVTVTGSKTKTWRGEDFFTVGPDNAKNAETLVMRLNALENSTFTISFTAYNNKFAATSFTIDCTGVKLELPTPPAATTDTDGSKKVDMTGNAEEEAGKVADIINAVKAPNALDDKTGLETDKVDKTAKISYSVVEKGTAGEPVTGSVTLPAEVTKALQQKGTADAEKVEVELEIDADAATVTLPAEAINKLAATEGTTIKVKPETKEEVTGQVTEEKDKTLAGKVTNAVDVTVKNEKNESLINSDNKLKNSWITITLKVTQEGDKKAVHILYLNEKTGTFELVGTFLPDEHGNVTFNTRHLSKYCAVLSNAETDKLVAALDTSESVPAKVRIANPNLTQYGDYNQEDYTGGPWDNSPAPTITANRIQDTVLVEVTVNNLKKHLTSSDGTGMDGYWLGIAIPKIGGTKYLQGWVGDNKDASTIENGPDGSDNYPDDNGGQITMDGIYWNLSGKQSGDAAYLIAEKNNTRILYIVTFNFTLEASLAFSALDPSTSLSSLGGTTVAALGSDFTFKVDPENNTKITVDGTATSTALPQFGATAENKGYYLPLKVIANGIDSITITNQNTGAGAAGKTIDLTEPGNDEIIIFLGDKIDSNTGKTITIKATPAAGGAELVYTLDYTGVEKDKVKISNAEIYPAKLNQDPIKADGTGGAKDVTLTATAKPENQDEKGFIPVIIGRGNNSPKVPLHMNEAKPKGQGYWAGFALKKPDGASDKAKYIFSASMEDITDKLTPEGKFIYTVAPKDLEDNVIGSDSKDGIAFYSNGRAATPEIYVAVQWLATEGDAHYVDSDVVLYQIQFNDGLFADAAPAIVEPNKLTSRLVVLGNFNSTMTDEKPYVGTPKIGNVEYEAAEGSDPTTITVYPKVSGLKAHESDTDSTAGKKPWVGIGIPAPNEYQDDTHKGVTAKYYTGWTSDPTRLDLEEIKAGPIGSYDSTQKVNGLDYQTFYFGVTKDHKTAGEKGYVLAVYTAENKAPVEVLYLVDFSNVELNIAEASSKGVYIVKDAADYDKLPESYKTKYPLDDHPEASATFPWLVAEYNRKSDKVLTYVVTKGDEKLTITGDDATTPPTAGANSDAYVMWEIKNHLGQTDVYGTYTVSVNLGEETVELGTATYAKPGATELGAGVVSGAILNQKVDAVKNITVTATAGDAENDVIPVEITASKAIPEHPNGEGTNGYWVGFALTAPEGATKMRYAFGKTLEDVREDNLGKTYVLEENVADGKNGIAFYADGTDLKNAKVCASVQWITGSDNYTNSKVYTYQMDLSKVEFAFPASLTFGAIPNEDGEFAIFDKKITEMGEKFEFVTEGSTIKVTGTAYYVDNYVGFNSSDKTEQQGYYLPIQIKGTKGQEITVVGSKTKTLVFDEDGSFEMAMRLDEVLKKDGNGKFTVTTTGFNDKAETYTVDCSKVLKKLPTSTPVGTKLADQGASAGAVTNPDVAKIVVNAAAGEADENGVIPVTLSSDKKIPLHYNGEHNQGFWVGIALAAPKGATGVRRFFTNDLDKVKDLTNLEAKGLEENVTAKGEKGYTFYANGNEASPKIYAAIQWTGDATTAPSDTVIYKLVLDSNLFDNSTLAPAITDVTNDVVLAGFNSNLTGENLPYTGTTDISAEIDEAKTTVTVKPVVNGLKAHPTSDKTETQIKPWVGIGIPQIKNTTVTYYTGWGDTVDKTTVGKPDNTQTNEDKTKTYDTFYWGLTHEHKTDGDKGYVLAVYTATGKKPVEVLYKVDFSNVTLALTFGEVPNEDGNVAIFGKKIAEMGAFKFYTTKNTINVTGSASYVTGYTGFNSADKTEQQGHYLPIQIKGNVNQKITVTGKNTKELTFGADGTIELVMFLDKLTGGMFTVEDNNTTYTVDYSKLAKVEKIGAAAVSGAFLNQTVEAVKDITVTATAGEAKDGLIPVTVSTEDKIPEHENGQKKMGYWVGFALTAPEGAGSVKYAFAATAEELKTAELTDSELEPNVAAGGKAGIAFYANGADLKTAKRFVKVQWVAGTGYVDSDVYMYEMNLDNVKFDKPLGQGGLTGATLNQNDDNVKNITVIATADKAVENVTPVTLSTKGNVKIPAHLNGEGTNGYWIGIALTAPEGAGSAKYAFGTDKASVAKLEKSADLEQVTADGKQGVAFYANGADLGTAKRFVSIQWVAKVGSGYSDSAVYTYEMKLNENLFDKKTEAPATLTFGAIPNEDGNVAIFGKKISDMGTFKFETKENTITVTGTAAYVGQYTGFNSADKTEQQGHYLPIQIKGTKGQKITVIGSKVKFFTFEEDGTIELVMLLDKLAGGKFNVTTGEKNYTVDFSGVTLAPIAVAKDNGVFIVHDEASYNKLPESYREDWPYEENKVEIEKTLPWLVAVYDRQSAAVLDYEVTKDGEVIVPATGTQTPAKLNKDAYIMWRLNDAEEGFQLAGDKAFGNYTVSVKLGDVTVKLGETKYAAPVAPTAIGAGELNGALLNQTIDAVKKIKVTAEAGEAVDGVIPVTLSTKGNEKIPAHLNGEGTNGYWIGFALTAPEGAAKVKYAFGVTKDDVGEAKLGNAVELEENVTLDGKQGVAFYANGEDLSTAKTWVSVQWIADESGKFADSAVYTYEMKLNENLFDKKTEAPATLTFGKADPATILFEGLTTTAGDVGNFTFAIDPQDPHKVIVTGTANYMDFGDKFNSTVAAENKGHFLPISITADQDCELKFVNRSDGAKDGKNITFTKDTAKVVLVWLDGTQDVAGLAANTFKVGEYTVDFSGVKKANENVANPTYTVEKGGIGDKVTISGNAGKTYVIQVANSEDGKLVAPSVIFYRTADENGVVEFYTNEDKHIDIWEAKSDTVLDGKVPSGLKEVLKEVTLKEDSAS